MHTIGNIIWLVPSGLLSAVMYVLAGIIMCCTIIGIPFGSQLIKFGLFTFWPFGKQHFKLARLSLVPFGFKFE